MSGDLVGGCLCGAVRYRAARMARAGLCHCRMCQKASGAPVVAFGKGILRSTQEFEHDALCLRCDDAGPDAAFGVDLWIWFARLIGRRRFPVIDGWFVFGRENLAAQNRTECKEREFCFHAWFRYCTIG